MQSKYSSKRIADEIPKSSDLDSQPDEKETQTWMLCS
jgi:hypothetical protein